ncbi:MAG: hypothetical protein AAGI44_07325 [Pseudomonadota bacterium]
MKLSVRSQSKEIPENQRVYFLQSGKDRRFFSDFVRHERVFMDFPGAELPNNFELNDDIKRELQKSYALGVYLADSNIEKRPPGDRDKYDPDKGFMVPDGKLSFWKPIDRHTMNAFVTLYMEMQQGDLVVVTERGGGSASVLIGEITSSYSDRDAVPSKRYEHELKKYPTRRVRWLGRPAQKHQFSVAANKAFGHQRAMHTVGRSIRKEVYDHAYGQYIFSEGSNMNIDILPPKDANIDPDKWQVDLAAAHALNSLVLYYGGFFNAIEAGMANEYASLSIAEAIVHPLAQSDPFYFESSIHSPGMNTYRAAQNSMKAIFVSAALSMTAFGAENPEVIDSLNEQTMAEVVVEYENQWNAVPTDCDLGLGEHLSSMMLHIGVDRYRENCALQKATSEKLTARSSAKMEVELDDSEGDGDGQ